MVNRRLAEQSAKLIVMERYKVILAYDGTAFKGMQRQASERTVQQEVEDALRKLGWQGRSILFSGRTDAGVHASGQVVAFDLEWSQGADKLLSVLNATLPRDVAARQVSGTAADFQPRFDATSRTYRYRVYCDRLPEPTRELLAWRVWPAPDLERMQAAADKLVGSHDFAAFGSPMKQGGPTIRNVMAANWQQVGDEFHFTFKANAFLYHMVRHTVGLLVKIGQGRAEVENVAKALSGEIPLVQTLAPAHGLTLVSVDYD